MRNEIIKKLVELGACNDGIKWSKNNKHWNDFDSLVAK